MKHSDYHGKLLRLAMFFVALFLCGTMAYAQTDRMISGMVVDENGDPLPAAHIRQVSQTKGEELAAVITDMNGHFRLTLLRTAKEIEISYLGYESKKVRLTSANSYRIVLEPASELLDEVYFALEGISKLLNTIKIIKSKLNPALEIEGFLLTMYDSRLRQANQIYDEVKRHFQELVFNTVIQRNVKLSEAPSYGLPTILYDADSTGAKNHMALAKELISRNEKK